MLKNNNYKWIAPGLFTLLTLCIFTFNTFENITNNYTAAVIVFTIGLFSLGLIPEYLSALIFFCTVMLLNISPATVVFSGFSSSGFWLILSGLMMGSAIKKSGLAMRFSSVLVRFSGTSYLSVITAMVSFGLVLSFIMPSAMGRVVLMLPILIAFAEKLGFDEGTKERAGIILAGVLGSYYSGFTILPSNLPNIILAGNMESLFKVIPIYGEYFLLHFPILGLLKSAVLIGVISKLFYSGQLKVHGVNADIKGITPQALTVSEQKVLILIILAIFFWMTDFLHHISPAWIGLITGILFLLPKIGVLDSKEFIQKVNVAPLFYVAGIIGLGAVVANTGIGDIFAKKMLISLPFMSDSPAINFSLLTLLSSLTGIIATLPGVPSILSPLGNNLSELSHLSLSSTLMTQVVGYSSFIFPYQAPPLIVALQLGKISLGDTTRLVMIMAATAFLILIPLDYLWWQFLGWV